MNGLTASHHQFGTTNPVTMPRYSSIHSNSSAFSASAGPNEDWTKISDLAERRRIQNRIAQRNYRKKLKKRLEDLERKAASHSESPEPTQPQMQQTSPSSINATRMRAHSLAVPPSASKRRTTSPSFPQHYSMSSYDDANSFSSYQSRHQSPAPSSLFSQPAFSTTETSYNTTPSYSFSSSYPSPAVNTSDAPCYNNYMLPRPTGMAPVSSLDTTSIKAESYEDDFSNFAINYMSGSMDVAAKSGMYREAAHPMTYTPPLSDTMDSFPSSIMGSPPDLWALYPSPPASDAEDDPPIFSLPLDLALDEPDFFKGL